MAPRRACIALITAVCLSLAACGGSDSDPSPASGGAGGSGGGDDLAALEAAARAACGEFAQQFCAAAKPCCESEHGGHDQAACEKQFQRDTCELGGSAVGAGRAIFNPNSVAGCIQANIAALGVCRPTWQESVTFRRSLWESCKIISGKGVEGQGCGSALDCAQPDGAATAVCLQGKCQTVRFLAEGEVCPYPNGVVSLCSDGLYCTAQASDMPGVCTKAVAVNGSCTPTAENTECGLGAYCDPSSSSCKLSTNKGGPSCAQHAECVSFFCEDLTNECSASPPVVSLKQCMGG